MIDNAQRRDGSYGFVLVMADVFSRRCWLRPLTTKKATGNEAQLLQSKTVLAAMREVWQDHSGWKYTLSDNGSEFQGLVTSFLQGKGVTMIKSRSFSGGIRYIESMNGAVRRMLARMKASRERTGAWSWARALPLVERELNEVPHSGHKLPPMTVWNKAREGKPGYDAEVYRYVLMRNTQQAEKTVETSSERLGAPLKPGDRVRLALTALSSSARKEAKSKGGPWAKASERQNFTRRIFTVKSASKGTSTSQRRYQIVGLGRLHVYQHETLRVRADVGKVRKDERPPGRLAKELQELDPQFLSQMQTGSQVESAARRWLGSTLDDGSGGTGTVVGFFPAEGTDPDDKDWEPAEFAVRMGGGGGKGANKLRVASLEQMLEYLAAEQPSEAEQRRLAEEGAKDVAEAKGEKERLEAMEVQAKQKKLEAKAKAAAAKQQQQAATKQQKAQAKAASLVGRRLEFEVEPGERWTDYVNRGKTAALLTGIVQKGERKINWRSPALFKGVEVERNLSRPRLLQLLRDFGV